MSIEQLLYFSITICTSLIITSCKPKGATYRETTPINVNSKDNFHQICDSSNKLVFKLYDLGSDSNQIQNLDSVVWENIITDQEKIKRFNNLFAQVKNGGYCCCIKAHYTVSFYKDNKELGLYYIDTTDIKDKIILFGQSYQSSYIIKLKDLNEILLGK